MQVHVSDGEEPSHDKEHLQLLSVVVYTAIILGYTEDSPGSKDATLCLMLLLLEVSRHCEIKSQNVLIFQ